MHSTDEPLQQCVTEAMQAKADFEASKDPGTYRRAVDAWHRLASHPEIVADAQARSEALANLGGIYLKRSADDPAALEEAIGCLTSSLRAREVPIVALELGDALAKRYRQRGDREDLDAAVGWLRQAVSAEDQPQRDYYLGVLGLMFIERYRRSGNLAHLTAAIRTFSEAVRAATGGSVGQFEHLGNLGRALIERGDRMGEITDLRRAVDVLTQARSLVLTGSAEESSILMDLGSAYRALGRRTGQRTDLDAAVQMIEAAAVISLPGPENSRFLANLGAALSERYEQNRDPADLDRAIVSLDRSLKHAFPGTRSHATRLDGLATVLANRAESRADRAEALADWRRAAEYFRASIASARSGAPDLLLSIAQHWLIRAAHQQDWQKAAEAAVVAVGEMRLAVLAQGSADNQQTEIVTLANMPAIAAFALAQAGRTEDAATALDQGRARLLTAALDRDRADVARLTALGHADLAGEYRRLAAEIAAEQERDLPLTLIGATDRSARQEQLRAEVASVLSRIRLVPGYERFQAAVGYPNISAAAEPAPLAYLFTTRFGGMALLVRPGRESPVAVPVPELGRDESAKQLRSFFLAHKNRNEQPQEWSRATDSVTRWAFEVIAPVLDHLTAPRLVLIPCGPLALAPLHGAWRPDPDQPGGRRYLLDDITITYAANARSLTEAGRFAGGGEASRILVVDDPKPTRLPPLPAAAYEAAAALARFPERRRRHLRGEGATRQAVTSSLGEAAVWHFACHAISRPDEPLKSGVLLAGHDWFTVDDIMKLHRAEASSRLAVLSACDTGVYGLQMPDEVVGLPTALLQAGVAGVVASLWPVADRLAALLSAEFYARWRGGDQHPAAALRAAQTWLRDAGLAELHDRYPDLVPAPPRRSGAASRLLATAPGPYADPVHWAAFTFWGV
ncbi:MAG: CHAT domain-containing protein [Streptosporangiaceae bacterium]|jgi:CHAT domain-containing protein